jgi:nitroreductase
MQVGTYVPGAMDKRPWRFIMLKMIFSHYDASSQQVDCILAAQNMMLAARSLLAAGSVLARSLAGSLPIKEKLGVTWD